MTYHGNITTADQLCDVIEQTVEAGPSLTMVTLSLPISCVTLLNRLSRLAHHLPW